MEITRSDKYFNDITMLKIMRKEYTRQGEKRRIKTTVKGGFLLQLRIASYKICGSGKPIPSSQNIESKVCCNERDGEAKHSWHEIIPETQHNTTLSYNNILHARRLRHMAARKKRKMEKNKPKLQD